MSQNYERNKITQYESNQHDLWQQNQEKIHYQLARTQLELDRQQATMEQRLEFEANLQNLKFQYKCYLKMMGSTVYQNSADKILYSLTDAEGNDIRTKVLLNITNYTSRFFVSYYPKYQAVLEISWGDKDKNKICFAYDNDGISPQIFLKRLKSRGVMLLVSGRTEREAAKALLAYSINNADVTELSYTHGWVKNKHGDWHFADDAEITLQEVLKNV